ncbi:cell wall biogenesis glycosyltransferase [Paraburkholderia hospita]|uniref:Cell wall biogenesis glycosyltransferase n=1 Tax=Paraburkholderia hospita TaxID=169430 RepID=A0ABP2PGZ2_9BURK|nr:glycosyltransferase family 2 protein [Paraburkholderia hospita]EIM96477.1 cell wall biogenesis glycosyltransferase [Paraburkholderia hospita]OUL93391.1 glycosyltransferase [Paraburkholderia hospita]
MDTSAGFPLISIAVPVLNEADNLDALYARLRQLGETMADRCRLEFVFTDNHSTDTTWEKLTALASADSRVRAIRFSKNVGFQRSILANYMHARGDAVMQIDADLQDPPELLERFFQLWREGYHVVYGVREQRPEGRLINAFRKFGYWVIDKLSEHQIPRDAGDFRLVDRKVIDALRRYRSSNPYLRGLIAGMGFRQIGVPYARSARVAGASKFGVGQLVKLGLAGVFNHSVLPLRVATYCGLFLLALSVLGTIYYVILRAFHPDLPRGLASIHILVLFGIGFQSLLLGILGEYLLRIYLILRAEPVAIAEETLNLGSAEIKL